MLGALPQRDGCSCGDRTWRRGAGAGQGRGQGQGRGHNRPAHYVYPIQQSRGGREPFKARPDLHEHCLSLLIDYYCLFLVLFLPPPPRGCSCLGNIFYLTLSVIIEHELNER